MAGKCEFHDTLNDNIELDPVKLKQLEEFIDSIETTDSKTGSLIEILHKAQTIFGYLPKEIQHFVANKLDIPCSEVFGVVSFYSFFTMKPGGKHTVSVCMGTACFVRGADKVLNKFKEILKIENNQTTEDGLFTLKDVRCVGACGLAPVVLIDDKVYGKVKPEEVEDLLKKYYE